MNIVALIPARAGSKRIPGKNIKLLGGKPLIQWTIESAKESGVFERIIVCSDSGDVAVIAHECGVGYCPRPQSDDREADIEWVTRVLALPALSWQEAFSILRPTSPFRTADTIRRAWMQFKDCTELDSIRALERWRGPHPGKMWTYCDTTVRMFPVMNEYTAHAPYHSSPIQSLVPVYVQNASLEMAWARTVREKHSISGDEIAPFFTEGWEGFDINTPEDWDRAERHVADLQTSPAAQ